jgi:hypothetical protein
MTMYNLQEICQFHKNVNNCDTWTTYKGGQNRMFYCSYWNQKCSN